MQQSPFLHKVGLERSTTEVSPASVQKFNEHGPEVLKSRQVLRIGHRLSEKLEQLGFLPLDSSVAIKADQDHLKELGEKQPNGNGALTAIRMKAASEVGLVLDPNNPDDVAKLLKLSLRFGDLVRSCLSEWKNELPGLEVIFDRVPTFAVFWAEDEAGQTTWYQKQENGLIAEVSYDAHGNMRKLKKPPIEPTEKMLTTPLWIDELFEEELPEMEDVRKK